MEHLLFIFHTILKYIVFQRRYYGVKGYILILFFADLVPRENVEAWLKYLKNEFPVIAFKASTQSQNENLVRPN